MFQKFDPIVSGFQVLLILLVALVCHSALTIFLMDLLGDAFDPYWKRRMLTPSNRFTARYRSTVYYSGAIVFKFVRKFIFENVHWDFRGRVDRATVVVSVVHQLVGFVLMVSFGLLLVDVSWLAWTFWHQLPRPEPVHFYYEETQRI